MPLISLNYYGTNFPHRAIQPEILDIFSIEYKAKNYTSSEKTLHAKLIQFLECFLQLINKRLDLNVLRSPAFGEICVMYIGAINSPWLFNNSDRGRRLVTNMFLDILERLIKEHLAFPYPPLQAHRIKNNLLTPLCVAAFRRLKLDAEKIRVWQGWVCVNNKGESYWAPLYPIYEKLGLDFTNTIHKTCIDFLSSRSENRVPCLKPLATFIHEYPDISVADLKSSDFMGKFWREFLIYYLIEGFNAGASIEDLTDKWRAKFVYYVENYLVKLGVVAETWGELPMPPNKYTSGVKTNIKKGTHGEYEHTKLITNVPLNCSDEDAMHLLFKQIEVDVKIATDWAEWAAEDMWARFQRKIHLSPHGTIVQNHFKNGKANLAETKWLRSRKNPDYLKNAAASLTYHIHIVGSKAASAILPIPLTQIAHELAIPVTNSLLPHCIILVSNHPQITASFLENLELFDKNGKQTGFQLQDGFYRLVSYKRRRGVILAQQSIILNETTVKIVQQIISLTSSLREFLKSQGDENWRYLFLTCLKGFSHPTRVKKLTGDTCSYRSNEIANSLQNTCTLDLRNRQDYMRRFSLASLRASSAVLVYLQTRSITEMAKALGHSQPDPKLIRRYLPDAILAFFQERWIRIFQSALLVEALKESGYLLDASGFNNIQELDAFLKIHALKLPPPPAEAPVNQDEKPPNQIIFGINSTILTILISLQLAVKKANRSVHYKATYWAKLTPYLITYIETYESHRPDLYAFLMEAKLKAKSELMEGIIYD